MFGLFNIHKSPGPTSHAIVAGVRHRLGRGIKVGHTGTLDPFASGVLVVAVGPATRLSERIHLLPKAYRAEVTLGAESTTDDPEGRITGVPDAPAPTEENIRRALEGFVGTIRQVPPAYSAVHVDGQRAYQRARRGQTVRPAARQVTIHRIELLGLDGPRALLEIECSTGTYIRSLARDLGEALGSRGYCSGLTRTAVGPFRLEEAVEPDALDPERDLISPIAALAEMPRLEVDAQQIQRIRLGMRVQAEDELPGPVAAAVDPDGRLIALVKVLETGRTCQPWRVFLDPPGRD
jgi:tRNA pseudouridine55 synthase